MRAAAIANIDYLVKLQLVIFYLHLHKIVLKDEINSNWQNDKSKESAMQKITLA